MAKVVGALEVQVDIINKMKKGRLITIYGINNIGKSTHAKILKRKLNKAGFEAVYIKFPNYDIAPTGPFLNEVLRNPEGQHISEQQLQMWFVLNRYQTQPEIEKLLNEGKIVVAEDYIGTGLAWGMAKGLDEDWLENANKYLIKEDLALMIEGERDLKAKEKHHVHEQNEDLIEKCLKTHKYLSKKHGWRIVKQQKEVMDTAKLIWKAVDDYLQESYS